MKKQIRLKNTRYTIKMAGLFLIGLILMTYLTMLVKKIDSMPEEEKEVGAVEKEGQTIYSFYEPLDIKAEIDNESEIDHFFTLQFPLKEDWNEHPFDNGFIPDESMGEELIQEYNYKLFLKGLENENPYVVWYSAYRLVEFYNSQSVEEIMLALAECEKATPYSEIKKACHFTMDILSNQTEDQEQVKLLGDGSIVFTRFFEGKVAGGEKAYIIRENLLSELFVWKDGTLKSNIKDISISPNGQYAWIAVQQDNHYFNYVVKLEKGKYPYYAATSTLYSTDGEQDQEFSQLNENFKKQVTVLEKESKQAVTIKGNWSAENTLEITCQEEHFTYMPEMKIIKEGHKSDWDAQYNYVAFVKELELLDRKAIQKAHYYSSVFKTIREEMRIGTESILIYEYKDNEMMESFSKNINALGTKVGNKVISTDGNVSIYKKGRLIVLYYGHQNETIKLLTTLLGAPFAGRQTY